MVQTLHRTIGSTLMILLYFIQFQTKFLVSFSVTTEASEPDSLDTSICKLKTSIVFIHLVYLLLNNIYQFFILTAAIVNILPDESNDLGVSGTIKFFQQSQDKPLSIQGKVSGLPVGKHGFHVHENKLKGTDCGTAGSHFNPEDVSSVFKKILTKSCYF